MKQKYVVSAVMLLLLALTWVSSVTAADIPTITKEELKAMMDNPKLVIVDVRTNPDWLTSDAKIKGAVREDPTKVQSWIEKYSPDKTFVFYCS